MEKIRSGMIHQLLSGLKKYNVNSLTDLKDNKDSVKLGRKGALFFAKGNYGVRLLVPFMETIIEIHTPQETMRTKIISPGFGIIDQFGNNHEMPITIDPQIYRNGKLKNNLNKTYVQNPIFLYQNITSFPKEIQEEIIKQNAEKPLIMINFENATKTKSKRKILEKLIEKNFNPILNHT
jgi:hypothetical protein